MKINAQTRILLGLSLMLLSMYFIWNLYPVQNYYARFMSIDSKRGDRVYESLKDDSDNRLLKLLSQGDFAKVGGAARVLTDRGENLSLYDKVLKKMESEKHELNRHIMEGLLGSLSFERGTKYYYRQLEKYSEKDHEYWTYINLLVHFKADGIFGILVEKAEAPNGWRTNAGHYLAVYGDPRALPVLQELKAKIPNDGSEDAWHATREIDRAIKKLEEIESANESKTVSAGEIKDQKGERYRVQRGQVEE